MNYQEVVLEIHPFNPYAEIITSNLADISYESFVEDEPFLKAYIPEKDYNENSLKQAIEFDNEEVKVKWHTELIQDQNWNAEWERNFPVVEIDKYCRIRADFHPKDDSFEQEIIIEPKMSFGTGHHATTFLMIQNMKELSLVGKNVLDMGCGTAVLAILAAKEKALQVTAIDIEDWAYENALENVQRNQCTNVEVFKAGAEILQENSYDIVLANINRNILMRDMPIYVRSMKADAKLLLSGFFESDIALLREKAESLDLTFNFMKKKEDWCLLAFEKQSIL